MAGQFSMTKFSKRAKVAKRKKRKEENDIRDYGSKQHEDSRLERARLYKKRMRDLSRQILFIERRERWKHEVR